MTDNPFSDDATELRARAFSTLKICKKGNAPGYKSPYKAAQFYRDLQALLAAKEAATAAPSGGGFSSRPSHTPTASESARETSQKSVARRQYRHWSKSYPALPIAAYRVPVAYRDAHELLLLGYQHRALAELGPVYAFTLNLRDDIQEKMFDMDKPLDWLRRRIDRELRKALGRPVNVILVLEEDWGEPKKGEKVTLFDKNGNRLRNPLSMFFDKNGRLRPRLHIHGEIGVTFDELERARQALCEAGGRFGSPFIQCHMQANPDLGWASYIGKNIMWTLPTMRERFKEDFGSSMRVRFKGTAVSCSRQVGQGARKLFEEDRDRLLRYLKPSH